MQASNDWKFFERVACIWGMYQIGMIIPVRFYRMKQDWLLHCCVEESFDFNHVE